MSGLRWTKTLDWIVGPTAWIQTRNGQGQIYWVTEEIADPGACDSIVEAPEPTATTALANFRKTNLGVAEVFNSVARTKRYNQPVVRWKAPRNGTVWVSVTATPLIYCPGSTYRHGVEQALYPTPLAPEFPVPMGGRDLMAYVPSDLPDATEDPKENFTACSAVRSGLLRCLRTRGCMTSGGRS